METDQFTYAGCCDELGLLDFSKVDMLGGSDLWLAIMYIILLPTIWLWVIYYESQQHKISHTLGSPQRAVVMFATILALIIIARDLKYSEVVKTGRPWYILQENSVLWSGFLIMFIGFLLIVASFRSAGFYHICFGEYFGIATSNNLAFPYNILEHPMYIGSTFSFLGFALVYASKTGILLTILIAISYTVSGYIETCLKEKLQYERQQLLHKQKLS